MAESSGTNRLALAFGLNAGFAILEAAGSWYTNSVAILTDAVHDLSDAMAIGLAWFLAIRAQKLASSEFSFGFHRLSLAGAFINSVVLMAGMIFILSETVSRLRNPEPAHAGGMFILAILGVAVNGFAYLRLKSGRTMNEKVITWHLLEDALGWVLVALSSVGIWFTGWYIIDPILSLAISALILVSVSRSFGTIVKIFLQAVPSGVDLPHLLAHLKELNGVGTVDQLNVWSLDGDRHVASVHINLESEISMSQLREIKAKSKQIFREHGIAHATIEIEFPGEECYNEGFSQKNIRSGKLHHHHGHAH